MNLRLALYRLHTQYVLSPADAAALGDMAGLGAEPAQAANGLRRGAGVLAASLIGLGLILWVAANWSLMSRGMRFGFLQGLIAIMALVAMFRPALRSPLLLLGFLLQGGLLAFFGQTYQTGADPWQLFTLWAALGLPWALVARSDVLWTPWVLVAMTAVSLWGFSLGIRFWEFDESSAALRVVAWFMAIALAAFMAPAAWRRWLGSGTWAFRLAALLACLQIGGGALDGLFFARNVSVIYWVGLAGLAVSFALLVRGRVHDVFVLSVVALSIDTLLVCGLGRLLFDQSRGGEMLKFLMLGVVAAVLVAVSVSWVLRVWRSTDVAVEESP
jgi:uncharacterized membrane protein